MRPCATVSWGGGGGGGWWGSLLFLYFFSVSFFLVLFFRTSFFGFPRFFLTIVIVQLVFKKIRENVLLMLGFSPVLFIGFPRFFLTIVVVPVPWQPKVTEYDVTPKWWKGVCMRNRKLRNIPLVGPFDRK